MYTDLEKKIYRVKSGKSEIFEEWKKYGLIAEEEFIEALEWLAEDELLEDKHTTREIGFNMSRHMKNKLLSEKTDGSEKFARPYDETKLKGKLVKLGKSWGKVYCPDGSHWYDFRGFYDAETGELWSVGEGRINIFSFI